MVVVGSLFMVILMALGAMAVYTLVERNFLGMVQLRKGPQKVGYMGLLQPVADAIKLLSKMTILPQNANSVPYFLSPVVGLVLALMGWVVLPSYCTSVWFKYGGFLVLCLSSVSVYPVMIAGWSSNSKYSLLGGIRSIAQTISYEVSMSFIFISLIMIFVSMNMSYMFSSWYCTCLMMWPIAVMWVITVLAETNRSPFDLAEGESELVSGFNTEYSSWGFTFIFMAEYLSMLMLSGVSSVMLLPGMGWLAPIKLVGMSFIFLITRASLPRMRYDQLMNMTWTSFLPVSMWSVLIMLGLLCFRFDLILFQVVAVGLENGGNMDSFELLLMVFFSLLMLPHLAPSIIWLYSVFLVSVIFIVMFVFTSLTRAPVFIKPKIMPVKPYYLPW